MKKLILAAVMIVGVAGQSNAQAGKVSVHDISITKATHDKHKDWIEIPSTSLGSSNSGVHSVQLPDGRGTLSFTKTGTRFSNVVFVDGKGKTHRLQSAAPGTNGAPQPNCKYPLPDACFATQDKQIGLCMCKPTDLTAPTDTYVIGLLLPAVQKVREAANR